LDLFIAKKALAALVLPPTGPLLIALLGLALLGRRPNWGRALGWFGVLSLLALSLPAVSHALLRAVDQSPALDLAQAGDAQAIVILGGGTRRAPEYGGDTLGRLTLERVRYGARLARKTKLPVLVSGGAVYGGSAEAALMKRALEEEFGVEVTWSEAHSRDTRSNALNSAAILLPAGMTRILLVAHGFDMPRASAEFASAGLHVTRAPTAVSANAMSFGHPVQLLPGMGALHASYFALYELLAEAVRRVRGWPGRRRLFSSCSIRPSGSCPSGKASLRRSRRSGARARWQRPGEGLRHASFLRRR
jgi:uncharacterized SAM-binding protein YcdF (DUF218 family)